MTNHENELPNIFDAVRNFDRLSVDEIRGVENYMEEYRFEFNSRVIRLGRPDLVRSDQFRLANLVRASRLGFPVSVEACSQEFD